MDMNTAPFIGAIADDLTGATDLALTLSRGGMHVRQVVGIPDQLDELRGAEAVVISLKSRTIPVAEAVDLSRRAAEKLLGAGARQLFFKYCSTFDSTNQGNIGPVIQALLALIGDDSTLACPAFPTNSRTIYKGHLFVGDILLSESSMKDHPLTPMRDANLVRVLQHQTDLKVSLIDIASVRSDPEALKSQLDNLAGIAIIDALDDADLRAIGAAAADLKLITGGSGVALGLPDNFKCTGRASAAKNSNKITGRSVVLAGSCSEATRRQISVAIDAGMPSFRIDPVDIVSGVQTVADALSFVHSALPDHIPVIYASAAPELVAQNQKTLGRERAGAVVEEFLATLSIGLVDTGFHRLIVAGGESSGAIINALEVTSLDIGPEIDPGVPWMTSYRNGTRLALALKSGNFGAEDFFVKAWGKL